MSRDSSSPHTKYAAPYETTRLEIIQALIPEGRGRKAIDVSCGIGVISEMLTRKGWSVTATESNEDNIHAVSEYSDRQYCGDALELMGQLEARSYQLLCVLDLIEHLDQRDQLLAELRRIADVSGSLHLSTPNRMSPEGLYGYYWGELLRGRVWKAWDETHGRIYSSFELLRAIERAAWKPDRIVGYHYKARGLSLIPFVEVSHSFPLNRFGFNSIVLSSKT